MQTSIEIVNQDSYGTAKKTWSTPVFEIISHELIKSSVTSGGTETSPKYFS